MGPARPFYFQSTFRLPGGEDLGVGEVIPEWERV
jgi:hypothetical protein